jgi:hypothetical protein
LAAIALANELGSHLKRMSNVINPIQELAIAILGNYAR